jgi:hypothetical protein
MEGMGWEFGRTPVEVAHSGAGEKEAIVVTPEARPEMASTTGHPPAPEPWHREILSIRPPVAVAEGDMVPAVLTIDVGEKVHIALPLGAFTRVNDKPCFIYNVDLTGLTAASLGIAVGALGVLMAPRIIRAIGEAEARRKGS